MDTILSADILRNLRIVKILDNELAVKLSSFGVNVNSYIVKTNSDNNKFATLKIFCRQKNIIIPGRYAKFIKIKKNKNSEEQELYDLGEGQSAVIGSIDNLNDLKDRLSLLGIKTGMSFKLIRKLPHMEYSILVSNKRRVRLTEALAATIIGKTEGKKKQLSFARRNKLFKVETVLYSGIAKNFLSESGIVEGAEILLEGIEAGKDICVDDFGDNYIYTSEGFRLSLSDENADKVIVIQE